MAFAALRANILRSILTMLGIVIGVAAVIAMVALGNGAEASVNERIAKLGTTLLQIDPQHVRQGGVHFNVPTRMTMTDVSSIEARAPHIAAVQPAQDKQLQIVWRDRNANMLVYGVTPNFLVVRDFQIDRGRMFTSA